MFKIKCCAIAIIIFLLASCSVSKRHYLKGYQVVWYKKGKSSSKVDVAKVSQPAIPAQLLHFDKTETPKKQENLTKAEPSTKIEASVPINLLQSKQEKLKQTNSKSRHTTQTNRQSAYSFFKQEFKKGKLLVIRPVEKSKETHLLAIIGFIASIIGLFVLGIILGILAVIFGCTSYTKIKREPEKWKGAALAIAAIVIGIVDVIGWFIFVTTFL